MVMTNCVIDKGIKEDLLAKLDIDVNFKDLTSKLNIKRKHCEFIGNKVYLIIEYKPIGSVPNVRVYSTDYPKTYEDVSPCISRLGLDVFLGGEQYTSVLNDVLGVEYIRKLDLSSTTVGINIDNNVQLFELLDFTDDGMKVLRSFSVNYKLSYNLIDDINVIYSSISDMINNIVIEDAKIV